jgi:hypothetical protein
MSDEHHNSHHEISYTVNGEIEKTKDESLTVRAILVNAGFTPAEDYALSAENPPKDFGTDYDLVVHIHENERFLAKYKAPTPTS